MVVCVLKPVSESRHQQKNEKSNKSQKVSVVAGSYYETNQIMPAFINSNDMNLRNEEGQRTCLNKRSAVVNIL